MTQKDIDKACKWLKDNLVNCVDMIYGEEFKYVQSLDTATIDDFITRFRKAMEE